LIKNVALLSEHGPVQSLSGKKFNAASIDRRSKFFGVASSFEAAPVREPEQFLRIFSAYI
jgi:hypothetical protein